MTWVKLDDRMWRNPKIKAVSLEARWAHVSALCCCGEWMTDGYVSAETAVEVGAVDNVLAELLTVNVPGRSSLWVSTPDGGYMIHDYLKYNPSRERYEADKRARQTRAKAGADARWNAPSNASSMAPSTDMSDATVPVPSRPHLKTTVQEDLKERPALPRMLAKILRDDIEPALKPSQILHLTAAWEADSNEVRQSLAAVEAAGNPVSYLMGVARRISPQKETA